MDHTMMTGSMLTQEDVKVVDICDEHSYDNGIKCTIIVCDPSKNGEPEITTISGCAKVIEFCSRWLNGESMMKLFAIKDEKSMTDLSNCIETRKELEVLINDNSRLNNNNHFYFVVYKQVLHKYILRENIQNKTKILVCVS